MMMCRFSVSTIGRNVSSSARLIFLAGILVALTYSLILPPPAGAFGGDKIMHAVGYGGLAALGALGWPDRIGYLAALVLLIGIGAELMQAVLPYRALEYGDMVANAIGVIAACAMALVFRVACRCEAYR